MQLQCPHCKQVCETEQELAVGQHVICPFCNVKFAYQPPQGTMRSATPNLSTPVLFPQKNEILERPVAVKIVALFYALGTSLALWSLVRETTAQTPWLIVLVKFLIVALWGSIMVGVWKGCKIGRWGVDIVSSLLVVLTVLLIIEHSMSMITIVPISLYWLSSALCHLSGSTEWFNRKR